jgi:hypothetical protein
VIGLLVNPTQADALMKWPNHPNLQRRPHAPAAGRGRLQRQIKRAFLAAGDVVLSTIEVYDWAYPRHRAYWRPMSEAVRWSVHRILRQIAEPIGRAPTIGRPWLWRLKDEHRK